MDLSILSDTTTPTMELRGGLGASNKSPSGAAPSAASVSCCAALLSLLVDSPRGSGRSSCCCCGMRLCWERRKGQAFRLDEARTLRLRLQLLLLYGMMMEERGAATAGNDAGAPHTHRLRPAPTRRNMMRGALCRDCGVRCRVKVSAVLRRSPRAANHQTISRPMRPSRHMACSVTPSTPIEGRKCNDSFP